MTKIITRKLGELVVVLLIVSFGMFMLASLLPGNPAVAILGQGQPREAYIQLQQQLGLNDPLLQRYWDWLSAAVQGDLGNSMLPPHTSVTQRVLSALPVSLELAVLGLFIALICAIPLAMWSAYRANGLVDRLISGTMFGVLSVPNFLAGMLLILVVVQGMGLFPRAEWVPLSEGLLPNLYHAFLPALTISLLPMASCTRLLRNDLITTLQEDFILAARAKGMPAWRILLRDALRPSSFSLITTAGVLLGALIGSTVIVESLFALPGLGSLIVRSAAQTDVAMVQGGVLVVAVIFMLVNSAIDISYGYLDPRIRRGHA